MINGHLSEAQQGFAILDEVDEETLLRFLRWTYTGDYPAREHTTIESEIANGEPAKDPVPNDEWGSWGTPTKDKKKAKKMTELAVKGFLRESFVSQRRNTGPSTSSIPAARANKGPDEDYTQVFLGHARMYVFSEKYDVQPLRELALQKLQHQLAIHTLYIERVGEITALLRYVYANTMAPITTIHEEDGIRAMLAHYIGVEMANLVKEGEIKNLMLEDADLLGDFLRMFALKIS